MESSVIKFFLFFFKSYPRRSALMIGLLILAGLAEGIGVVTLVPLLELSQGDARAESTVGRVLTDGFAAVGIEPTLGVLLGIVILAMAAKAGLMWLAMTQVGYTVARVTRDLRLRLIRSLFEARWRYFGQQASGSFANAISSEAHHSGSAYRQACNIIAAAFQVLVYVIISALISWHITLFGVIAGALLLFALRGFVRKSREAGQDQTRLYRSLSGRLVDVLQGVKAIKAMARERLVLPLLEQESEGLNQAQRRQIAAVEARNLVREPVLTALLAVALFILVEVGDQPLSAVLVLAFVFYRLLQQIHKLQDLYQTMVVAETAFWSLREQIDAAESEREDAGVGAAPGRLERSLILRDIRFSYEQDQPVLRDLNLEIPAGTFVAITGESGSGKTTLADLIIGLHQPKSGGVLVDDRPLRELSLHAWRKQIGYVPQELLLFNDTISRNVTLGDESLSDADVERALRMAGAWSFVSSRPGGVHAEVGQKGDLLSGGQRQRIAIARALVHRPSLLVLDEATTALDPATEQAICQTLQGLAGELTILSISHQPAMKEVADIAYHMRDGLLLPTPDRVRAG